MAYDTFYQFLQVTLDVLCIERIIDPLQNAAQLSLTFHQVTLKPSLGQRQRSRHTCDPAAHDQTAWDHFLRVSR